MASPPSRAPGFLDDLAAIEHRIAVRRTGEATGPASSVSIDENEKRYRHLVENSLGLICTHDLDGVLLSVNPAAAWSLGYEPRDGEGRNLREFLAPATRHLFDAYLQRLRTSPTDSGLMRVLRKDGTERIWLYRNVRYDSEPGRAPYVLGHAIDVTDRAAAETALRRSEQALKKAHDELEARVVERTAELVRASDALRAEMAERQRLEEQVREAVKLEAVSRLAGGIAHDFNNLLTIIIGAGELLRRRMDRDEGGLALLDETRHAAERAAALTRQLLTFSRRQAIAPRVLDLNAVVARAEGAIRRVLGDTIRLTLSLDPALVSVEADEGQVEQILMNLAANARDALPGGGDVAIGIGNVELDERRARALANVEPGSYVRLSVSDTGCGMDASTKAHLFEPFFTTKPQGKGTGLGLAAVYGIVLQSGGGISVESEPGRGARFDIFLPDAARARLQPFDRSDADRAPEGTETILLVEDEPAVRWLIRSLLEEKGYRVLAAANGAEALRIVAPDPDAIDLLVTDIVMPGMTGGQLHEALTRRRPGLKAVFMSGYTDQALLDDGDLPPDTVFLQKPFALGVLAHKVRELLDA